MSRADAIFIKNCREILDTGYWDTEQAVRPRWEDGCPAFCRESLPLEKSML